MNELDQEIALAARENNALAVEALTRRVYYEFWLTPQGEALNCSADRDAALERLMTVFEQRYADAPLYPGVLFIHRLVDCASDLLAADPNIIPEAEPSPEISEDDEIAILAEQFRQDMDDPNVSTSAIKQRRESSAKHRKAWILANTPDPEPESRILPNDDTKQFAYLVNESVRANGISSIKPRGGFVILIVGAKRYEYPVQVFNEKYELAASHNLIR